MAKERIRLYNKNRYTYFKKHGMCVKCQGIDNYTMSGRACCRKCCQKKSDRDYAKKVRINGI